MKTSAVIIVCNGEEFITKQLDNIYDSVDQIVIAEGADPWFSKVIKSKRSTDKTIPLIKGYKDPDKKIKLIHVNASKNAMVKEASKLTVGSDFIYQVDVDEFIRPENIKYAFEILKKGRCQTVGVPQRWYYKWHDTYLEGARPYKCRAIPIRFFKNRAKDKVYPSHIPCNGYYNDKGKHMGASFTNLPFKNYSYHYLALYRKQLELKLKYYIARDRVNSKILTNRLYDFDRVTRKQINKKVASYSSILRLEENPFIKF